MAHKERPTTNEGVSILMATNTAQCTTAEQFADKISDYIAWCVRNGAPTKLNSLNRRFGKTAAKFNTTVREVVMDLEVSGEVKVFPWRGGIVIMDGAWCAQQEAYLADDAVGLIEARERMFARAQ